jgi:hypothetical protein
MPVQPAVPGPYLAQCRGQPGCDVYGPAGAGHTLLRGLKRAQGSGTRTMLSGAMSSGSSGEEESKATLTDQSCRSAGPPCCWSRVPPESPSCWAWTQGSQAKGRAGAGSCEPASAHSRLPTRGQAATPEQCQASSPNPAAAAAAAAASRPPSLSRPAVLALHPAASLPQSVQHSRPFLHLLSRIW